MLRTIKINALSNGRSMMLIATWGLIAMSILVAIYGIYHGFDWTDEAWAFSLTLNGHETPGEPWAYQYLLNPVLNLLGGSVIAIRWLRLFAYVFLGLVATWVFLKILVARKIKVSWREIAFIGASAQIGTVLAWAWPPRYFAYNELNSIGVQVACLFIALLVILNDLNANVERSERIFRNVLWLVTGLTIGLVFYAKFTSFLLLFPVLIFAALLQRGFSKILATALAISGVAIGVVLPWGLGLPLKSYISSIIANVFDENVRAANTHPSGLIGMYIDNIWGTFLFVFTPAVMMLVIVVIALGVLKVAPWAEGILPRLGGLILTVLVLATSIFVMQGGSGAEKTGRLAVVLGTIAVFLFILLSAKAVRSQLEEGDLRKSTFRSVLAFALLVAAPIVVSLGTNNPLTFHFGFGATTWCAAAGAVLVVLSMLFKKIAPKFALIPIAVISLAALLSLIMIGLDAKAPYRSASFFANKQLLVNNGALTGLNVTPAEADWANWLNSEVNNLRAEDVATLSLKYPGALLAFNNSSFASPWLEAFWPASFWSIDRACEKSIPSDLIVLQPSNAGSDSKEWPLLQASLASKCGLNFPSDFEVVGSHISENPQLATTIWRLKSK